MRYGRGSTGFGINLVGLVDILGSTEATSAWPSSLEMMDGLTGVPAEGTHWSLV